MNKFTDGTVRWVVDSGHGWLRVPMESAAGLEFSEFSYVDPAGRLLYLEEDCDAGVWLKHHGVSGRDFPADVVNGSSAIRNLPRVVPAVR